MAALADEAAQWRPKHFLYKVFGSESRINFPIANLESFFVSLKHQCICETFSAPLPPEFTRNQALVLPALAGI